MRSSVETDRTQVATNNSQERLETLEEKQTNASDSQQPGIPSSERHNGGVLIGRMAREGDDLEQGNMDDGNASTKIKEKGKEKKDSNLVEWNGPHDPENPMNWPTRKKWRVTIALGAMTLCVTFASSVFSTATRVVAEVYNISTVTATLATSLFVLGFGFGPLVSYHVSTSSSIIDHC